MGSTRAQRNVTFFSHFPIPDDTVLNITLLLDRTLPVLKQEKSRKQRDELLVLENKKMSNYFSEAQRISTNHRLYFQTFFKKRFLKKKKKYSLRALWRGNIKALEEYLSSARYVIPQEILIGSRGHVGCSLLYKELLLRQPRKTCWWRISQADYFRATCPCLLFWLLLFFLFIPKFRTAMI